MWYLLFITRLLYGYTLYERYYKRASFVSAIKFLLYRLVPVSDFQHKEEMAPHRPLNELSVSA
jgi:hypothetical protein